MRRLPSDSTSVRRRLDSTVSLRIKPRMMGGMQKSSLMRRYPAIPAAIIITTSPILLLIAKVPTVQNTNTRGFSHFAGTRLIFEKIRMAP